MPERQALTESTGQTFTTLRKHRNAHPDPQSGTHTVLTSHVTSPPSADGSQSEPATAFAAAEDLDWPPFGRRTPSAVGKRLAKRTETLHERCNTNGSECRRATVTQSTRVPWSAELVAAQLDE